MTTLLVARHGNTFGPGDVVTRVGARTDLPLVEGGIEQATRLGHFLRAEGLIPSKVFSSQLKRTIQTAEIALGAMGLALSIDALHVFNEIDYGPDENRPEVEVIARLGQSALTAWDKYGTVPPGWNVDVERIKTAWLDFGVRAVNEFQGQTILVVTSNGIARFAPVLTGDWESFVSSHPLKISPGAVCQFQHDGARWLCSAWNLRP